MGEEIPKETETIAVKRSIRVSQKVNEAKSRLSFAPAWWTNQLIELVGLVFVFGLNLYLVLPLFGKSAPESYFSGPVIPFLAKLIELTNIPFSYAVQLVNIAFFLFFPFPLYIFVKQITGRKIIAFLSILITAIPFYPFGITRIHAMFFDIDGSHVASLTLVPLAIYGFLLFCREGKIKNLLFAVLFASLVVLTSPFGFFVLIIFAVITTFSEMLLGRGRLKMIRFLTIFAVTGGLISFWYNPAFSVWMALGPMGEEVRITISKLIPVSFYTVPVLGAFGFLLFDRKPDLQPIFLASFYTIAFGIIVLAGGVFFPSRPSRYAAELGISLGFLISTSSIKFLDYLRFRQFQRFNRSIRILADILPVILVLVLVSGIFFARNRVSLVESKVLGIWDDVNKAEIWEARDKFSGIATLAGYGISLVTISGLGVIAIKSRKEL